MNALTSPSSARLQYAELLREFMAGKWTTDQYEDRFYAIMKRQDDSACAAVFDVVWHFYSDVTPHKMRGRYRLPRELRKIVARWVLFLRSESLFHPLDQSSETTEPAHARVPAFELVIAWCLGWLGMTVASLCGWWTVSAACAAYLAFLWLGTWVSGGVCLNPQAVNAAFANDGNNIWPFPNEQAFAQACQTAGFLNGSCPVR